MFKIMGKHGDGPQEEIDEFATYEEAEKMLIEYKMAYGPTWKMWIM